MKTYRGVVRGNTVLLNTDTGVPEGTVTTVIIKAPDDEDTAITRRQKGSRAWMAPLKRYRAEIGVISIR